jgi:hypothetical protein
MSQSKFATSYQCPLWHRFQASCGHDQRLTSVALPQVCIDSGAVGGSVYAAFSNPHSRIIEQRHEAEVHVQLLVVVERGEPGTVGHEVHLYLAVMLRASGCIDARVGQSRPSTPQRRVGAARPNAAGRQRSIFARPGLLHRLDRKDSKIPLRWGASIYAMMTWIRCLIRPISPSRFRRQDCR